MAIKIVQKIKRRMKWIKHELYWLLLLSKKNREPVPVNNEFSIGITTFKDRYHLFFKKLLKRMSHLFPGTEIVVVVNGHYNKKEQLPFLKKIEHFCSAFPNVRLITFVEPQGLSKLWNQIILNTVTNKTFIFNDDIKIAPVLRKNIQTSGILAEPIATIRNSWSYFLITKEIINKVGWFDERLKEIGGEDDDYLARLALKNITPSSFDIDGILNYSHKLKRNSYGKDMTGANLYSSYNSEFLFSKWEVSPGFIANSILHRDGNYWKLKENMDTPDFYGSIVLNNHITTENEKYNEK